MGDNASLQQQRRSRHRYRRAGEEPERSVPILRRGSDSPRYDKGRLPTPPPDPTPEPPPREQEPAEKEKENDILNYLDYLQTAALAKSGSVFSPAVAAEDAFDHLERLYKLMDQMLVLREQNARLHRRVRDLEHANGLQKLRRQLENSALDEDLAELDRDAAFADSIYEGVLRDTKGKGAVPAMFRHSILRKQRNRSSSINLDNTSPSEFGGYRASRRTSEVQMKTSKVSKWTKVKAAFKWEKASTTVGSAKSHDSGLGGMLPVNIEVARYLRVPSTSDEVGLSPSDSGAAEVSTPGSLSNASSADDMRKDTDEFHSSDDERQYLNNEYIPNHKDEQFGCPKATCGKTHRTPWSKMKDMIQTRNSFKKKHRLSARSDDTRPDETAYSENEDVFEDENGDVVLPVPSPSGEVPRDVVERYQRVLAEEANAEGKVSRWNIVKRAFLPSPADLTRKAQDEIDRNYKQLQQKLSLEFQEKLAEWEKNKATASNASAPSTSEDTQDPAFLKKIEEWQRIKSQPPQLQSEENLPPDFRKKLQEWEKIKRENPKKKLGERPKWKSVSRAEEHRFEYPQLSEEFLKKLEEWKQIKASGGPICTDDADSRKSAKENRTPSPRMARKPSPSKQKKAKDGREKELQWFEKELGKIEKEKQRLERERQKFLEREERLTKLRRSVTGNNKKEVLVHTRTGFHRFEGISRKFTRKLYEWEKAQGIAPEESTFALLTSCYAPEISPSVSPNSNPPTLTRSKSADSVVTSALNLTFPVISHQPSSLSLNDVENLEKECLGASKRSSMEYSARGDDEEPEALIVEVEDIVEETAAPLVENYLAKRQTPVYQHEAIKSMCAGEACLAPKVRRSESARAQTNYNLIEESIVLLRQIDEVEDEIGNMEKERGDSAVSRKRQNDYYERQRVNFARLCDKLTRLQEANAKVTSSIADETDGSTQRLIEVIEAIQDLSLELPQIADRIDGDISSRDDSSSTDVHEAVKQMNAKILELRRLLSYVCAASDMTAPGRKKLLKRGILKKQAAKQTEEVDDENACHQIKEEEVPSQGAIKKRIRHRQKSLQARTADESEDDDDETAPKERKVNKHKKLTRTRSVTDDCFGRKSESDAAETLVVPTETNFVSAPPEAPDSPVTVFVKTTRKLFTPVVEKSGPKRTLAEEAPVRLPPLPASPTPQRKTLKDMSPNIRIMLQRYNRKISEQDNGGPRSAGSSGSNSPVAWRSPTFERRVKAQTERYQEEVERRSPLSGRRPEVQKSASVGIMHCCKKQVTTPGKDSDVGAFEGAIAKSSSARDLPAQARCPLKLSIQKTLLPHRTLKLQKAKEDFLSSGSASAPVTAEKQEDERLRFPSRNRLSQISVESESSCDSSAFEGVLIKSASAGMINIDADAYRKIDPEVRKEGYVSLPRNCKKSKSGFLESITSKFRKIKMRKGRDKSRGAQMDAVSALCRQSLVVDINKSSDEGSIRADGRRES